MRGGLRWLGGRRIGVLNGGDADDIAMTVSRAGACCPAHGDIDPDTGRMTAILRSVLAEPPAVGQR